MANTISPTTAGLAEESLESMLEARRGSLRSPDLVMSPTTLGAARLTRYSFGRSMIRRAVSDGWEVTCRRLDLDQRGCGEVVYDIDAGSHRFSFVALTTTLEESEHTDRVTAAAWEITAALVEGTLPADLMELLRAEVPRQEQGRLDPRVLVLTRGNRSVRFFENLVEVLASGHQPDADLVADAGYILRSTAFYGNGKFGIRSYEAFDRDHPLGAPYRAQFLAAWLFRELGYDLVEHCARARGGTGAVGFENGWRTYFGLGNATGLGLVPFAFKHPRIVNAWAAIRELALADVRAYPATPERVATLAWWTERALRHFSTGSDDDCSPFLAPRSLAPVTERIIEAFDRCRHLDFAFDALYRWAEDQDPETRELVVSLLIELHDADDADVDRLLRVEEERPLDPTVTVGEVLGLIRRRFDWIGGLDLDRSDADAFCWVLSDNNEEPRRTRGDLPEVEGSDVPIDFALRIARLRQDLTGHPPDTPIHRFLATEPAHRLAVERVVSPSGAYGEPRDNPCAAGYLPLQLQRFQLAMYGMDNFKPKSTDWLRVTLFQGAPRVDDIASKPGDDWVFPERPVNSE